MAKPPDPKVEPMALFHAMNDINSTLVNCDNEATESPYWMLIKPLIITLPDGTTATIEPRQLSRSFEGPFFSRADADNYLKRRHYDYPESTIVWCASGYWSDKYKALCRALRIGMKKCDD